MYLYHQIVPLDLAIEDAAAIGDLKRAIRKAMRLISAKDTPKHKNLAEARLILKNVMKKVG